MRRCLAYVLALILTAAGVDAARAGDAGLLKPTNVGGVNTDKDEDDPHVSSNGLRLYYTSKADGRFEIRVSERRRRSMSWPAGKAMADLEDRADCRSVSLSADGRYPQFLFFASNKDPEKKDGRGDNFDIYFLIKQGPQAEFTTPTSVHSVCTKADELYPWLTADGRQLYFSRKDKDGWHVYVTKRPRGGGQFGEPALVKLPAGYQHATLTPDGRTMYLQGPLAKERWGLFRSTLNQADWTEPEALSELNSADAPTGDRSPCLSRDGVWLYFASDRPGGKGGLDLWVIPTAQLKSK